MHLKMVYTSSQLRRRIIITWNISSLSTTLFATVIWLIFKWCTKLPYFFIIWHELHRDHFVIRVYHFNFAYKVFLWYRTINVVMYSTNSLILYGIYVLAKRVIYIKIQTKVLLQSNFSSSLTWLNIVFWIPLSLT